MATGLAPFFNSQFFTDSGVVAAGYYLYSYLAGTTTPKNTKTDQGGLTNNANPIILDTAGRCALWLEDDAEYAFELKTPGGVALVKRWDDVGAIPVAATATYLPLAGGVPMTGRYDLSGVATSALNPVPLSQAQSLIAAALATAQASTANVEVATTTTGTSTVYAVTPTNVLGSYAVGSTRKVIFHTASGSSPTLNISGLGAKALKTYENDAKVNARLPTGYIADVTYDGTDLIVGPVQVGYGTIASTGSYTLPGGLIVKWGTTGTLSADTADILISFAAAFPTACFGVLANASIAGGVIVGTNYTWSAHTYLPASFRIDNDGIASTFFYVAIGN
jgi:uncharacterized membrane protein